MSKSEDEIIRHQARTEWNAAAPGWKKYGKDMLKWLAPVSDQLIRSTGISIGQTVLDVATGTGEPALTIAKIVGPNGKVIGVDLSLEMLEVAKEQAAYQGLTNVIFQIVKDETVAEIDTAEEFWQGMTEVTGSLVLILSKLPEEKKLAIKNDVIESLHKMFPSGSPVKFTGELILGTATKLNP